MKYLIYVFILEDSKGEWWETLNKGDTTQKFYGGTADFIPYLSFKTIESAKKKAESLGLPRYKVCEIATGKSLHDSTVFEKK